MHSDVTRSALDYRLCSVRNILVGEKTLEVDIDAERRIYKDWHLHGKGSQPDEDDPDGKDLGFHRPTGSQRHLIIK